MNQVISILLFATLAATLYLTSAEDLDIVYKITAKAYEEYNKTSDFAEDTDPNKWSAGIETWESPEALKKGCPYYVMGKDYDGRLVYVWELGHCDFLGFLTEQGPQMAKDFDKHLEKLWWLIGNATSEDNDEAVMLVMDSLGYGLRQLTSLEVIKNKLKQARRIEKVQGNMANPTMINLTFISQTFMDLIAPIAGRFIGRIERISKREKWEPYLKSKIPKDQLPPFYGGSDSYKPLSY